MNKKLIALMIVPIMLTLSGAMAYSAFSGQITTNVNAKAGDLTFSEGAEIHHSYFDNTMLTVSGGYGSDTVTLTSAEFGSTSGLATVPASGGATSIVYYLNVSNLAPGNWVGFTITLVNTGSVGLIFETPTIEANSVMFTGATGVHLNLTNVTAARDSGHYSTLFELGSPLSGLSAGTLFATNYGATPGGSGLSGYAFAFGTGGPAFSNFGKSRDYENTADFNFYIGLSSGAGNGYQESSVSIPIIINVVSDP